MKTTGRLALAAMGLGILAIAVIGVATIADHVVPNNIIGDLAVLGINASAIFVAGAVAVEIGSAEIGRIFDIRRAHKNASAGPAERLPKSDKTRDSAEIRGTAA